ncbi:MAG: DUF1634 domain-containing protein [Candidatus Limnocylindrales bacterium]
MNAAPERRSDPVAGAIARLLNVGTLLSVGLVAVGVVLLAAAGLVPAEDAGPALDPSVIVADIVALRPAGLLWAGLAITVVLPTTRVALAMLGFLRLGDRRAAAVAAGVFSVLMVAFGVAVVTR